jgi:non-specific serine/threonine protein kinase/serine/threonine-protein kinase
MTTSGRLAEVRRVMEEALALPAGERDPFLERTCHGDAELRTEVAGLLALDEADDGSFDPTPRAVETSPEDDGSLPPGTLLGPWELGELIASGGMGSVHRGRRADASFEKDVAIKLIRRGLEGAELRRRFETERQVLASLEHPRIARLLDGGVSDAGRTYLVMEFVDGEPIDHWCRDQGLPLRERLALFREVCEAVHHAHRNLVVHRDLKPGNILVTATGEPKLLDFGIAKVLDPETRVGDPATVGAEPLMTPEYASPEQVRGERITTASDVYSLGVVLYELVCGRRPHDLQGATRAEVLRSLCEVEPIRPSEVSAGGRTTAPPTALRGDVDTIVLKALHVEPERRYASAEQLSEDIGRHLDGLPVLARPDTWAYRASKFVRRNSVSFAACVLLVIALAAGLVSSWSLYLETLRISEERDAARLDAQQRFEEIRELAGSLLFEVNGLLVPVVGATAARERLVELGLAYLERLAEDAGDERGLRVELIRGYLATGDLQGGPRVANLGHTADALISFERARELAAELHGADDDEPEARLLLATAMVMCAELSGLSDGTVGDEAWSAALALCPAPEEVPAHEADVLHLRAMIHERQARQLRDQGRLADARAHDEQALAAIEALHARQPEDFERSIDVAVHQDLLAQTLDRLGDAAGAQRLHDESAERLGALLAERPEHAGLRRTWAANLSARGRLLARAGRQTESLALFQEVVGNNRALLALDPANAQLRRDLGVQSHQLGHTLLALGRLDEALESFNVYLQVSEEARAAEPSGHQARADVATAELAMTRVLNALGRPDEAIAHGERARALLADLAEASPDDAELVRNLAISSWDLGKVHERLASLADDEAQRAAGLSRARAAYLGARSRLSRLAEEGRLAPGDRRFLDEWTADAERCERALDGLSPGTGD